MGDDRRDDRRDGPERRDRNEPRGGPEFLDLEMSQVIFSGAEKLCVEAARDLLRESIRERLRERMGPRLQAVGRLAADEFVDDVEANLDIEGLIRSRVQSREALEAKLAQAFASTKSRGSAKPTVAKAAKRKKRR